MEQHQELCRYVLRPPLANHRLRWLGDDELLLALKRKWADGTTHIVLSPSELLARLAALVPPKGFNLTRYHGCLAPRSSVRDLIVPAPSAPDEPAQLDDDPEKSPKGDRVPEPPVAVPARPRRIPWAELPRRVCRGTRDGIWQAQTRLLGPCKHAARPANLKHDIHVGRRQTRGRAG
ncbi:MAG: transposase [Pseudomonadota bacterium]